MEVADFNALGLALVPDEAQAPLIVDAYAVLSCPVTGQGFKMVGGWYPRVIPDRWGAARPSREYFFVLNPMASLGAFIGMSQHSKESHREKAPVDPSPCHSPLLIQAIRLHPHAGAGTDLRPACGL
jgi:hypothetical protein